MSIHGTFHWHELNTRDADKAREFYGRTMGWTFDEVDQPDGPYWIARAEGRPVCGLFTMAGPHYDGIPEHWFSYLAVEDVDALVYAVAAAGGLVLRVPWDLPGVGRVTILRDSNGAAIGWVTPERALAEVA